MMHIFNFDEVDQLIKERKKLLEMISISNTKGRGYLGVTLQGKYQDDEMCDIVRPVVLAILKERLGIINDNLMTLGVLIPDA